MSRELVIYAQRESVPAFDDIVGALLTLGATVEWRHLATPRGDAAWRRVAVATAGGGGITASTNSLTDDERRYLSGITEAGKHHRALKASRRQYFLSEVQPGNGAAAGVLESLAQVIAERTDGIVHEPSTDRYLAPRELGGSSERGTPQ